jgi:hypothetical protein
VTALLTEFEPRTDSEVAVHAYAPLDVVAALENAARVGDGAYMPALKIELKDATAERLFRGFLTWDGTTLPATVADTMGKLFDEVFEYFFFSGIGALFELDADLCKLHGLRYELVRVLARSHGPARPWLPTGAGTGSRSQTMIRPSSRSPST